MPAFFVPFATIESQDSVYASLARMAHCAVPVLAERIFSLTHVHDGEEWTATVGEHLRGVRHTVSRSRGRRLERTIRLSEPAIVLAIFAGNPYVVAHRDRDARVACLQKFLQPGVHVAGVEAIRPAARPHEAVPALAPEQGQGAIRARAGVLPWRELR